MLAVWTKKGDSAGSGRAAGEGEGLSDQGDGSGCSYSSNARALLKSLIADPRLEDPFSLEGNATRLLPSSLAEELLV